MTSLVIPFRFGRWGETELKYCLRSVQKHLSNYGELFIIGDKPKGIKDYIHVPYVDDTRRVYKEKNIYEKVMLACDDERVSGNFIYLNDDHFLNSDYEAKNFPFYYGDWPVKTDMYKTTIDTTRNYLKAKYSTDNSFFYDVHCPMTVNKWIFRVLVSKLDWNIKAGYCMKSVYGNLMEPNGHIYYPDLKIKYQHPPYELLDMVKNRLWFSTDDQARDSSTEGFLKQLYNVPSKWEI